MSRFLIIVSGMVMAWNIHTLLTTEVWLLSFLSALAAGLMLSVLVINVIDEVKS